MNIDELSPLDDGVTHINVYSKGETKLGRFLTNMSDFEVSTIHGDFSSMEGYWHWLVMFCIKPDFDPKHYQKLNCFEAKKKGKVIVESVPGLFEKTIEVKNDPIFRRMILYAITNKIQDTPGMIELVKTNILPYHHYYYYGPKDKCKIHYQHHYTWITDYLDRVKFIL